MLDILFALLKSKSHKLFGQIMKKNVWTEVLVGHGAFGKKIKRVYL